jgi:hypothetical protein
MDTDSIKLKEGYDKTVIEDYNKFVVKKLQHVSKLFNIPIDRFCPKDSKGVEHMLGVFDKDGNYEEFITQGAKKYAYTKWIDSKKVENKKEVNIQKEQGDKLKILEITVARRTKNRRARIKRFDRI